MLKLMVRNIGKKLQYSDPEIAVAARRLQILTCCEIFISILPSYRIIDRSEEPEPTTKLSKDVKKQWDVEEALLTTYQQYLTLLEVDILKKTNVSKIRTQLLKQIRPAA